MVRNWLECVYNANLSIPVGVSAAEKERINRVKKENRDALIRKFGTDKVEFPRRRMWWVECEKDVIAA